MSEYLKKIALKSVLETLSEEEQLAKNEIESAHRKIKHANESIAKANERVDKAEKEVERLRGLFHKWKSEKDNAVWESDTIFNALLESSNSYLVDKDCNMNSKEWFEKHVEHSINKFAIEKKADEFERYADMCEAFRTVPSIEGIRHHAEQLRKEQE